MKVGTVETEKAITKARKRGDTYDEHSPQGPQGPHGPLVGMGGPIITGWPEWRGKEIQQRNNNENC